MTLPQNTGDQRAEDAAILQNYLDSGGTVAIPDRQALGQVDAQQTVDQFVSGKPAQTPDPLAARKAILADRKLTVQEKQQELKELQLEEQQREQAQQQAKEQETVVKPPPVVAAALETTAQNVNKAADWIAALPTPGGILALVLALMFFVWCAVPVGFNGETRAYLLYLTLTGRTQMNGAVGLKPEFGPSLPLPTNIFSTTSASATAPTAAVPLSDPSQTTFQFN